MLLLCNTGKREQRLKEGVWGEDKEMTERERKIREEENVYLLFTSLCGALSLDYMGAYLYTFLSFSS